MSHFSTSIHVTLGIFASLGMFRGQFWKVENLNRLIDYGSIISNGIRQITPLRVKESHCILVIYEYVKSPHIFCDFNLGQLRLMKPLSAGKYIRVSFSSKSKF